MSTTNFVQLPPDGVGKKVRHRVTTDIKVTSITLTPAVGTVVYGNTSGAFGTLSGVYSAEDTVWYLKDISGSFSAGETLRNQANTQNYATASVVNNSINSTATQIVDADTPEYTLTVDKRGAALTSFPEGTPQFDAFGRQQLSQLLAVGEYYHFTQELAGKYYTTTEGGSSSVKYDVAQSSIVYTTGTGSTDWAKRVTNQYHPYKPGVSQLAYTSVEIGDTGKANVVREWGYFDDFNGFGFRLDGTTLKVFYRTDSSGTVVDTTVSQANWNVNALNSATASDFLLDVSKSNLYWMDVQGTVGRIRLGVETPDGRRITCHEFRNINNLDGTSIRNLTLPLTWAQRNTGSVSSSPAATQSMRVGDGVVFTESADVQYTGVLTHIIPNEPIVLTDPDVYKPFLQFKAKNTVRGPVQDAGTFITGYSYTITSIGTTDFTLIGASANVVGVQFTATGAGTGSGKASANMPNSVIGIHETFDWASQGDANIHIGIFVLPSQKWVNNHHWSETIQPATMLYVDTNTTDMAQYQYWAGGPTGIAGSISGTTLTVTSLSGSLLAEMYVTPSPTYANGPLYINGSASFAATTGSVLALTQVLEQLTATGSAAASPTYGTQTGGSGVAGSNKLVLSSLAGVAPGQLIAGTNLPAGTTIEGIKNNVLTLSKAFTGTGSGTYNVYTKGGVGTYRVSKSQTVGSLTGYGGYYKFWPIESFVAPANSEGRTALGDRIEKSFGLGGNPNPAEDEKGVFAFAAKPFPTTGTFTSASLLYTKYWKEIR